MTGASSSGLLRVLALALASAGCDLTPALGAGPGVGRARDQARAGCTSRERPPLIRKTICISRT